MEKQVATERVHLEEGLLQLSLDVQSFKKSLKLRKKLQYAYTTKEQQIKTAKNQIEHNKKKDLDKLAAELHEYEKAASVLKVKFEECSRRVSQEFLRVR